MSSTLPGLFKRAKVFSATPTEETTLIRTPQGRLVALTFHYSGGGPAAIIVRAYPTGETLATVAWGVNAGMGTAIVAGGVLHVFATVAPVTNGNYVVHATLDANWVLSSLTTIYTADPSFNICNLGITATPHLGYVMSLESQAASRQVFFLESADLNSWATVGTLVATGEYLGSPKIHWSQVQGKFFVTYLRNVGGAAPAGTFFTNVMRLPADLSSFEVFAGNAVNPAGTVLVYPDGGGETKNASDLTLAEDAGKTFMVYLDGDQTFYPNLRTALYRGTPEQLWQEFWPVAAAAPPPPPSGAVTTMAVTLGMNQNQGPITFRQHIAAGALAFSGTSVRVKMDGPSSGTPATFNNVFIGHVGGAVDDFDGNQVRLTFAGANAVTPPVGSFVWSDWVTFNLNEAAALIVAFDISASNAMRFATGAGANFTSYYKESVAQAGVTDVSGYFAEAAGTVRAVSAIEVMTP